MPGGGEARRRIGARLRFARAGGRTALLDQFVPYPFHVTRVLRAGAGAGDPATVYLQSASGGVYADDDLSLALTVADGAAAHVTTQSATIVHDTFGRAARLATMARVAHGGFLALLPDPLVLFPGATLSSHTDLVLADDATAILVESVCLHDPRGEGRVFDRLSASVTVRDTTGRVRLHDRGEVDGHALGGMAVLGRYRAWGLLLLLAPAAALPDPAALEAAAEASGCHAGASPAPNGAGLAVRLAGPDGGVLGRCVGTLARQAALGIGGWTLLARGK